MKITYGILLVLCFCFVGCKDKTDPQVIPGKSPMISQIKVNGKLQTEFIYDRDNKLSEIKKYFDDGASVWESRRYEYSGNQVVRAEFWSSHPLYLSSWPAPGKPLTIQSVTGYEYSAGQSRPVKELNYAADGKKLLSYTVHSYNASNQRQKSQLFLPDGKESNTTNYKYDSRGNVTDWEINGTTSVWEYDTRSNPMRQLQVPYIDPSWTSPNNATANYAKNTQTNVWRYEYTYDTASDFPLTMKTFVDGKLRSQSEFIYRN